MSADAQELVRRMRDAICRFDLDVLDVERTRPRLSPRAIEARVRRRGRRPSPARGEALTRDEAEVYAACQIGLRELGRMPTLRELRDGLELRSALRARTLLERLRLKGYDPSGDLGGLAYRLAHLELGEWEAELEAFGRDVPLWVLCKAEAFREGVS